jgi:hypothetical protein
VPPTCTVAGPLTRFCTETSGTSSGLITPPVEQQAARLNCRIVFALVRKRSPEDAGQGNATGVADCTRVLAHVGKQHAKSLARLAAFAALKMVPGLQVNLVGGPAWSGLVLLQRGIAAGGAGLLLGSCGVQVGPAQRSVKRKCTGENVIHVAPNTMMFQQ